jgi:FkbM family methyltransferase
VVSHAGVLLDISLPAFSPKLRRSIFLGKYEINEIRSAARVISAGDTVVELGSGCGFVSCALAKLKKLKMIHCVEANPEMIPVIAHHHQLNGVKGLIHNEIIGGSDGEIDFYVQDDFWASSAVADPGGRKVTVKATRLADRLREWHPDVLIMDIEGGELALVDCELPQCIRALVIELHESMIGSTGVARIIDHLRAQGFARVTDTSSKTKVATFVRRG